MGTEQSVAFDLRPIVFTKVGNDPAGRRVLDFLERTGAQLDGVQIDELPTTTAEVIIVEDERTILIDDGQPSAVWSPVPGEEDVLSRTEVFVAGGTFDSDGTDTVLKQIVRLARQLDKRVCLNPSRIHDLHSLDLSGVSLIQVSTDDLANFGFPHDSPADDVGEAFLRRGAENVVVTNSAQGEWGFNASGCEMMPALPGREPRYPVGCGDTAFIGHAAHLILHESEMCEWLTAGTLAGGFYVEHGRAANWSELWALGECFPHTRVVRHSRRLQASLAQ